MTLLELVTILGLNEETFIPSKMLDMKIVNQEDFCRFAEMNYFKSGTFITDSIHILNELLTIIDANLLSTQDFALIFKRTPDGYLYLQLTHNCY